MSTDRAEASVEAWIAAHVAASFQRNGEPEGTVAQIRNRITDSFQIGEFHSEQDNHPPALVVFYRRVAAAFSPVERLDEALERSPALADLKDSLERLRSALPDAQRFALGHAQQHLLFERQRLLMQNEITEGLGRIEIWILSLAFLALVLLQPVSIVWALPFLALSIGRSWQLDRRCKRRLRKIAEIDRLVGRNGQTP